MAVEVSRAAKVGAMSLALALAALFGYRFIDRSSGTGNGYRVHAYMPDVNGRARVDIRMRPEYPLYEDAAIAKRASSLIGESLIVLAPGTEGRTQIPNEGL